MPSLSGIQVENKVCDALDVYYKTAVRTSLRKAADHQKIKNSRDSMMPIAKIYICAGINANFDPHIMMFPSIKSFGTGGIGYKMFDLKRKQFILKIYMCRSGSGT
jgi:hypothetical protein